MPKKRWPFFLFETTEWYLKQACPWVGPIGRKNHHNVRKVPLGTKYVRFGLWVIG
jgi:hypothetical protein